MPNDNRFPIPLSLPESRFPFQRLDAYRCARSLAALVHRAGIRDAELRDQATRAAKSAFLNLCEGLPDDRPAMRRKYFASADGSLHETVGAVDLAEAVGAVDARAAAEIHAEAVRLRAMLRGLLRPTARGR
jgi:four helix bundle protein